MQTKMKCHNNLVTVKKDLQMHCTPSMILNVLFLLILVPTTNVNGRIIYEHEATSTSSAFLSNPRIPSESIEPQLIYKRNIKDVGNADYRDMLLESYNLLAYAREDICKHCLCTNNNKLRSVHCDYRKNHTLSQVFGSNFEIPTGVNSILINLASNTRFELRGGLFHNNIVNSFIIEGLKSDDQVEFAQNAFLGNKGGYPDIRINNVKTVFIRQNAFSAGEIKFTVQNCDTLHLFTDAFTNVNMTGNFVGIQEMSMQEKAFNSAHAKLRIENAGIAEITRFEASVHEIRFINCRIGVIRRFTFDVTNINYIVFENCRIETIETRAITDKLHSDHVSITNAVIGVIDSEAIYGSGISELLLTNNSITSINDRAISVHSVNVTIAKNEIKHLGSDWLTVKDWAKIIVEQNKFGTFGNMALQLPQQPGDCSFTSNSLTNPQPGSLNISNCRIHEISIKKPCTCNLKWLNDLSDHDLRSETYCTVDSTLQYCFNATSFNTLKYWTEVCDESKLTLDCGANGRIKKVDGRFFTPEELANRRSTKWPIIALTLGIICFALIALVVTTILCFYFRQENADERFGFSDENASNSNISSPRHIHEFTPEERHIIHQTLDLLKKKYPNIYKAVKDPTKFLLQADLNEKKCVNTITQIVTILGRARDPSDDFVEFDRVLTQHLQQRTPTAPPIDPIYTEPGLARAGHVITPQGLSSLRFDNNVNVNTASTLPLPLTDGGDFYSSSFVRNLPRYNDVECNLPLAGTIASNNAGGGNANGGNNNNNNNNNNNGSGTTIIGNLGILERNLPPEHIYAEPSCAQQPLLRNEYASPADRHLESMDLYSEPINDRETNKKPPTYECTMAAAPKGQSQPQPPSKPNTHLPQYAIPKCRTKELANKFLVSSGGAIVIGGIGIRTTAAGAAGAAAGASTSATASTIAAAINEMNRIRNANGNDFEFDDSSDSCDSYDSDSDAARASSLGIPVSNVRRLAKNFQAKEQRSKRVSTPREEQIASYIRRCTRGKIDNALLSDAGTEVDGSTGHRFIVSPVLEESKEGAVGGILSADEIGDDCEMTIFNRTKDDSSNGSEHSGGSAETVRIGEKTEHDDA